MANTGFITWKNITHGYSVRQKNMFTETIRNIFDTILLYKKKKITKKTWFFLRGGTYPLIVHKRH